MSRVDAKRASPPDESNEGVGAYDSPPLNMPLMKFEKYVSIPLMKKASIGGTTVGRCQIV